MRMPLASIVFVVPWIVACTQNAPREVDSTSPLEQGIQGVGYKACLLGYPPDVNSVATRINEGGQVIGAWQLPEGDPTQHSFSWKQGTITELPSLGGSCLPFDLNPRGTIAGSCADRNGNDRAVLWEDGGLMDLSRGVAYRINARGQAIVDFGGPHASIWERGALLDIGSLGGTGSNATSINDAGQVTGTSDTEQAGPRAFLWSRGVMKALTADPSVGGAINAAGDVLLDMNTPNGPRTFIWRNGRLINLGTLGGAGASGLAINNRGDVIGFSENMQNETHAFVWQDGAMVDLGAFDVRGMNNRTQIIMTKLVDNQVRAYVWDGGELTQLPAEPEGTDSAPIHINDKGDIVGVTGAIAPHSDRAVLWTRGACPHR